MNTAAKRIVKAIARPFELGDHEHIKAMGGPWPFRFFVTKIEPRYASGFSWRIRCSFASLLIKWTYSCCTLCGQKITLRELLSKRVGLIYFQSGSICHKPTNRKCAPSTSEGTAL